MQHRKSSAGGYTPEGSDAPKAGHFDLRPIAASSRGGWRGVGGVVSGVTLIVGCSPGNYCDGGDWFINGAEASLQLSAVSMGPCTQATCTDGGLDCSGRFTQQHGSCTLLVTAKGVGTCTILIPNPGPDSVVNVDVVAGTSGLKCTASISPQLCPK